MQLPCKIDNLKIKVNLTQ